MLHPLIYHFQKRKRYPIPKQQRIQNLKLKGKNTD